MRVALDPIAAPDTLAEDGLDTSPRTRGVVWLHALALVVTGLSFLAWCATADAADRPSAAAGLAPAPVRATPAQPGLVEPKVVRVNVPAVAFRRIGGQSIDLQSLLTTQQPVLLNFVRSSCGPACAGSAKAFAGAQAQLGGKASQLRMVSISLEALPETPEQMRAYAQSLRAGEQWEFLSGSPAASLAAQRAFGAARSAEDNPAACAYFRAGPAERWVRLSGPVSASDVLTLVRRHASAG